MEAVEIDVAEEAGSVVDVTGSDFVGQRDEDFVAFGFDEAGSGFPLTFAGIDVEEVDSAIKGAGDDAIAALLALSEMYSVSISLPE